MLRTAISGTVLLAFIATSASATHLSDVQGSVLVNNRTVASNIELAPGDRVRVVSGSARIIYNNDASINVAPGQTIVVLQKGPEDHVEGAILPLAPQRRAVLRSEGLQLALAMLQAVQLSQAVQAWQWPFHRKAPPKQRRLARERLGYA